MKRCPTCSRVYDDVRLRFCLDDGTELVNKPFETPAPQTLAMPAPPEDQATLSAFQPPPPPPSPTATVSAFKSKRERNLIVWILVLGLGLPFIGGVIAAGWMAFHKQPLTWHLVLEVDSSASDRSAAVSRTANVIASRLDALGLANYEVRPDPATGRIVINLPATDDPERVKRIISTWGKLEIVHVIGPPSPAPFQTFATREEAGALLASAGGTEQTRRVLPFTERDEVSSSAPNRWVVVDSTAIVTGNDLRDASAVNRTGAEDDYQISFSLKPAGATKFGVWTGANINEYIGVVLNDEVKSIAYIKSQIFDQAEITGTFTKQSAEDLALVLRAGALPVPVRFVEETVDK